MTSHFYFWNRSQTLPLGGWKKNTVTKASKGNRPSVWVFAHFRNWESFKRSIGWKRLWRLQRFCYWFNANFRMTGICDWRPVSHESVDGQFACSDNISLLQWTNNSKTANLFEIIQSLNSIKIVRFVCLGCLSNDCLLENQSTIIAIWLQK